MKIWSEDYVGEIPKFVLTNTSIYKYKAAVQAGHIVAVLHIKVSGDCFTVLL
ncbi:MAG: hypothetical protein HRT89_11375 [Lentisphaeria bacterium]|nr:hypothetical protein [Lentisphaeria bacterium]NQZ68656.1 hypothetical protein [Lentisphaeria bacterium]